MITSEAVEEDYEVLSLPTNPTMKMDEFETVKEYFDKLLKIANKAQEQRRLVRSERSIEGALDVKDSSIVGEEEEQLFVATCLAIPNSSEKWLIDSGCTDHMTFDRDLFKKLDTSLISKVKIGNGEYIAVKGKGTVAIESVSGFKVIFESDKCLIKVTNDNKVFNVQMKGKNFALGPMKEEQTTFSATNVHTEVWHKRLEYTSYQFNYFCEEAGIEHQLTTPYTPQQNGVSERKNRTIMEMARCLMFEKHLPKESWAEVAHTATFLLNRLPTKAVIKKTPYEAWIKRDKLDKKQKLGFLSEQVVEFPDQVSKSQPDTNELIDDIPVKGIRLITEAILVEENKQELKGTCFGTIKDQFEANTHVGRVWSKQICKKREKDAVQKNQARAPQKGAERPQRGLRRHSIRKFTAEGAERPLPRIFTLKMTLGRPGRGLGTTFADVSKWRDWERPLEAIWGVGKLSHSSLGLQASPMKEDGSQIGDGDAKGRRKWSIEQLPRTLGKTLHLLFDFWEVEEDSKCIATIKEELLMIEKNETWKLVRRPTNRKVISVKWIFRTKLNPDGSINKHKAKLVVKAYPQIFGVDFSNTFAPVARLDTIRLMLAIAAQKGWKVYQLDVRSAFLNCLLEEEIYVEKPEGFTENEELVRKFKEDIKQIFEMTDFGKIAYFLGMEINQKNGEKEKLSTKDEIEPVDETFYRSLVGCLMYLTTTRPDILHFVSLLSRFTNCATGTHLILESNFVQVKIIHSKDILAVTREVHMMI
ncbi:hypothetical protein V8G54_019822 [Vigna mungo]|uniref:Integrase catalytic domain-containing protein n=1 Tax=Vigna mungo TaxID=3915 RepID=A0AAQ3NBH9_VIGMU